MCMHTHSYNIHVVNFLSELFGVGESTFGLSDSNFCRGRDDGIYPDVNNCRNYFECSHTISFVKSCPENTAFHPQFGICDFPYNVPSCQFGTWIFNIVGKTFWTCSSWLSCLYWNSNIYIFIFSELPDRKFCAISLRLCEIHPRPTVEWFPNHIPSENTKKRVIVYFSKMDPCVRQCFRIMKQIVPRLEIHDLSYLNLRNKVLLPKQL